jgi:Nicastrin
MVTVLRSMGEQVDLNLETVTVDSRKGVPPSALQTFLLQDRKLPGVVLTEHRDQYLNRHYQSRLDQRSGIEPAVIADFATMLARSLYSLAG